MSDQVDMVTAQETAGAAGGEENAPVEPVTPAAAAETAPVAEQDATSPETPVAEEVTTPEVEASAAPEAEIEAESNPVAEPDTPSEPVAELAAEAEASSDDSTSQTDANKRQVRVLSVGQEVQGTVKRIADFGAFIDIGVGRDGLIHISELSVRRVGKVTDVLSEGQEVTAWIKKLDRDRNRISLTLIDPETKTIRDLEKDEIVQGTVTRILPYGAFVDIGIGRDALLHVREMASGFVAKPEDVVSVGETIEARIIELSRRRGRVDLSLKGLRPEPEAAVSYSPEPEQSASSSYAPEPEEDVADIFEDTEVLSPMELAFKRAMEAEGIELPASKKKQGKRNRRDRNRSIQDEIIARTLDTSKK